jgi:hypothetical protein
VARGRDSEVPGHLSAWAPSPCRPGRQSWAELHPTCVSAGGAARPGARGPQYSGLTQALGTRGSEQRAVAGRGPETRAASTGAAWSGTSTMSCKCDVVVVGGGISGQWRLRDLRQVV